jgi:hypothetical protein
MMVPSHGWKDAKLLPIVLRSGDIRITADIESTETFSSPSTGAELRKLTVVFRATAPEQTSVVQSIIKEQKTIESLGKVGEVLATWAPCGQFIDTIALGL